VLGAVALADIGFALTGHEAGGVSPTGSFGLGSLADAAWTYSLQLGHVVWPQQLVARYFPPTGAWFTAQATLGVALAALTVAAAWLAYKRGSRAVAFAIGAAFVAYLPTGGILPLPRGPADSYMYLPLAIVTVAGARALTRGFDLTSAVERVELTMGVALAIAIGILAARGQTTMWRDSSTLWTSLADAYPDDPRALMRVGDAYLFEQRPSEALLIFEDIARRYPDFDNALSSHADALMLLERDSEAERHYAAAARAHGRRDFRESYAFFLISHPSTEPTDPELAHRALVELAPVLAERGKRPRSLQRAEKLLLRYGEREDAAAIRARIQVLDQRRR
jgi:tetratricopeptide (TPR) repeat protein